MKDLRSRFGFHATPFTREIQVKDCFHTEPFKEALRALLRVLDQRMSGALIAPAGVGKTALLRALVAELPEARYKVHYVKVTDLSKRDMCREIALAIGSPPAGNFPSLVRRLQDHFLSTATTDGLRPVMILDESHDLRPGVFSLLRVLTNFEMDSRLVLSIVLAGQPPLLALLRRSDMEAVAKRLAHYATLRPLSREETMGYVNHRCHIAGATTVPFDPKTIDALYEVGRGNLRATDSLALKTLEVAHDQNADVCDASHVVQAKKLLWP